jgi:hypothetical protein
MFTHFETRHAPQDKGRPGKLRRNDRRAVIARKNAFIIDGMTVRH